MQFLTQENLLEMPFEASKGSLTSTVVSWSGHRRYRTRFVRYEHVRYGTFSISLGQTTFNPDRRYQNHHGRLAASLPHENFLGEIVSDLKYGFKFEAVLFREHSAFQILYR